MNNANKNETLPLLTDSKLHHLYLRSYVTNSVSYRAKPKGSANNKQLNQLEIEKKFKLPLLKQIIIGDSINWKICLADDDSYLAWLEVNDKNFRLSNAQRLSECLYLMYRALNKNTPQKEMPLPGYAKKSGKSSAPESRAYIVMLPHLNKYSLEHLQAGIKFLEQSWFHHSAEGGFTIKTFIKPELQQDVTGLRNVNEEFENIITDSISHTTKELKNHLNFTEKKLQETLKEGDWLQAAENVSALSASFYDTTDISEFKRLFFQYLIECQIPHFSYFEIKDNPFLDYSPNRLPLEQYKSKLSLHCENLSQWKDIWVIKMRQLSCYILSVFIENVIKNFPNNNYFTKSIVLLTDKTNHGLACNLTFNPDIFAACRVEFEKLQYTVIDAGRYSVSFCLFDLNYPSNQNIDNYEYTNRTMSKLFAEEHSTWGAIISIVSNYYKKFEQAKLSQQASTENLSTNIPSENHSQIINFLNNALGEAFQRKYGEPKWEFSNNSAKLLKFVIKRENESQFQKSCDWFTAKFKKLGIKEDDICYECGEGESSFYMIKILNVDQLPKFEPCFLQERARTR